VRGDDRPDDLTRRFRRTACEHVFVPSSPTILHADADAFFAAVEQRDDPRLRGKPVIVGGGVVMAASYEARAYGVRGAMGGRRARALCPHAIVVKPRHEAYVAASHELMDLFAEAAPVVEAISIEEAFLDLGEACEEPAEVVAARLRREAQERVGLTITVGAATTKILAKVASRMAKPDGLLVIDPDDELSVLHGLRVDQLWGIGPATATKLRRHGLLRMGQVAQQTEPDLIAILGPAAGRQVHAWAHNRDGRPVRANRPRSSFGAQRALGREGVSPQELDEVLDTLVERVSARMSKGDRSGRTVVLRLRFADFTRATRSRALPRATTRVDEIREAARALLAASLPVIERRGVTLLGITVGDLDCGDGTVQLELPMR
jgi:DNA polymerase-4